MSEYVAMPSNIIVELIDHPSQEDWMEVKRRALVTIGKKPVNPPSAAWMDTMLEGRHSPIRWMRYTFYIECPSWVATHLARHIHAQPYIKSQRNDRQSEYDRNAARQDTTVCMLYDVNAEELQVLANKRLCSQAAAETTFVVSQMCQRVIHAEPELCWRHLLVPMCEYNGGVCHEPHCCGRGKPSEWHVVP